VKTCLKCGAVLTDKNDPALSLIYGGFCTPCSKAYAQQYGGKVYFLGDQSGRVKIGSTGRRVKQRKRECQTGNAENLVELGCITGKFSESTIHRLFAKFHIRGEWFHRTPEIDEFIAKHCSTEPPEKNPWKESAKTEWKALSVEDAARQLQSSDFAAYLRTVRPDLLPLFPWAEEPEAQEVKAGE
jgi:hypothetical protein